MITDFTTDKQYILTFDSANEVICVGLGKLEQSSKTIDNIATSECKAHRASNTLLLEQITSLLDQADVEKSQIACIAAGRGPGSFTGVRICLATAKGIASALNVGLIGISTLDAVAWGLSTQGQRGHFIVMADAMRQEIYPVKYNIDNDGKVKRQSADRVLKAKLAAEEFAQLDECKFCGDGLYKYAELFPQDKICDSSTWDPTGIGLLKATEQMWQEGLCNPAYPACIDQHNPGLVLPVYTRLSDAEETERQRLADTSAKNLNSGVQNPDADKDEITYSPVDAKDVSVLANLESSLMKSDAWNEAKFSAEQGQPNRSWWCASIVDGTIVGYAGALVAGDEIEILKVAVDEDYQRKGIATKLLSYVSNDCRDLGAKSTVLEVRASNENAINFYEHLGLSEVAQRNKYYSDGEDAIVMSGPLLIIANDVGGMHLRDFENTKTETQQAAHHNAPGHPIIFAIESSCDETAASISCNGEIISDVVASQIDFHKRFGGVVPEIASRKHIEAICGVCDECFEKAAESIGNNNFGWNDIDAVAATTSPGLVGALVVGMAFAKGAAWAADKKFIGVNHLEGHLYANKLSDNSNDIIMPAVASVISGGNTLLIQVNNWGDYKTLGSTIDDAVGEAFDKVAKALSLGYPGGPIISKLAARGDKKAIDFPRAMMHSGDLNFSLSGLKTAVITYIQQNPDANINDVCASFQAAVIDVQVEKARHAIRQCDAKTFMFGGGVAANPEIRNAYKKMCEEECVKLVMPPLTATGDNAAMIALVAHDRYLQNKFTEFDADVAAHAPLDDID